MAFRLGRGALVSIILFLVSGCCSVDDQIAESARATLLIRRTSQLVYRERNRWPRDEGEIADAAKKLGLDFRAASYHMVFQPQADGDVVVQWLRIEGPCHSGGSVDVSLNDPSSTQPGSDAFLRHLAEP